MPRLDEFAWLERYRPWGVSPISFLEVAFLFTVLIRRAGSLDWTRDPFDRFSPLP